jgi:hypothetical protein
LSSVPPKITRASLDALFSQIEGYKGLYWSDTSNKYAYIRHAYICYDNSDSCGRCMDKFNFIKVDTFELKLRPNQRTIISKHAPEQQMIMMERVKYDVEQSMKLAKKFDIERNIETSIWNEHDFISITNELKQLNIILSYLRYVHHYCYYCHVYTPDAQSLFLQCGSLHPRDDHKISTEETTIWLKDLDTTIQQRLEG